MNIPKQVKVGGHYLDVVITNNCDDISDEEIGITYLAKNIIRINANYPHSRQEEALLHEIIHNCLWDMKEEQDEKLVKRLGVILHQIIIDNPDLFKAGENIGKEN